METVMSVLYAVFYWSFIIGIVMFALTAVVFPLIGGLIGLVMAAFGKN